MGKLFSKNRYRIVEYSDKEDNFRRKFRPERRVLYFFWEKILAEGCDYLTADFLTIEEANDFLYDYHRHPEKRKGRKNVTHEFNEVFHKLKK